MSSAVSRSVVRDLLRALQDDDLSDISLLGNDGVEVRAHRFVLAARSPVLKRMLFGGFKESSSDKVPFVDYTSEILRGVVEYCYRDSIDLFSSLLGKDSSSARCFVQLHKAADYFELQGLSVLAERRVHGLIAEYPQLACPVYDEADLNVNLATHALKVIEGRPYVSLRPPEDDPCSGGVECLSPNRILSILQSPNVAVSEHFLFKMLSNWVKAQDSTPQAIKVAQECASHLHLENIEPTILLSEAQQSGFVSMERITTAIMKQALRASQNRVWSLSCRGPNETVERVLVEDAGSRDVDGVYYRINGLTNGDIYSKHELSCGQRYVYTLACSVIDGKVECRIFCSSVLTNGAISTIQNTQVADPVFQPIVQIIQVDREDRDSKHCRVLISDGDYYMSGTLAEGVKSILEKKENWENLLIRVTSFATYRLKNGDTSIHIQEAALVGTCEPSHRFGNPKNVCSGPARPETDAKELLTLYSCQYRIVDLTANDSRVPRSGWKVESHGLAPGPSCTLMPGVIRPVEPDRPATVVVATPGSPSTV